MQGGSGIIYGELRLPVFLAGFQKSMDLLLYLNLVAVGQIILIDILLGGDNAIVIALA